MRGDKASLREGAHRAAALAARGYWLLNYGEILLSGGDVVGASAVAAQAHSPSLTVRVMSADGRLRGALETAATELAAMPARFETSLEASKLAAQATEDSGILERSSPLAEAFDRAGDPELADRVDAPALEDSAVPSLALVRAAIRANKRRDCAAMRLLAQRVAEKWELADEKPPAVDRMKKLAAACGK